MTMIVIDNEAPKYSQPSPPSAIRRVAMYFALPTPSPHKAGVESDAEQRVVLESRVVHRQVGALEVLRYDRTELREHHPLVLRRTMYIHKDITSKTSTRAGGHNGNRAGAAQPSGVGGEMRLDSRHALSQEATAWTLGYFEDKKPRRSSCAILHQLFALPNR